MNDLKYYKAIKGFFDVEFIVHSKIRKETNKRIKSIKFRKISESLEEVKSETILYDRDAGKGVGQSVVDILKE